MSTTIPLIVIYQIGDGYTFTATEVVPVMAESRAAFLSDFELAMAAYEPDRVDHTSRSADRCSHRADHTEDGTPRRTTRWRPSCRCSACSALIASKAIP